MSKAIIDTNVILRILAKDNGEQCKKALNFIKEASSKGKSLYLPAIVIMEIVWVLESYYKLSKKEVRNRLEPILNTPELKCEMKGVFKEAISIYVEKNIKFADAVIGCWGLANEISVVYTYDEKDFKRINGLDVRIP